MKKTSYNQWFSDNSILNFELMTKIGGWKTRIHDRTLTFYGFSQQLANHYYLDNVVYGRLTFMYANYGERGGDKKSNFFSGDGIIEDHWVKENRLERRRALTLSNLELRVEIREGEKG